MKILNHPSRMRVLLVTLIVSGVLVLAPISRVNADQDSPGSFAEAGKALIGLPVAALVLATYFGAITLVTVMSIACTPIAAVTNSDHPEGFSGAFVDCFDFALPAGENNDASD